MRPIKVYQNGNVCGIRWSYESQRYSLTWGTWGNQEDKARFEICARNIYIDCLAEEFDFSLQKYKQWLLGVSTYGNGNGGGRKASFPPLKELLAKRIEENYNDADQALLRLLCKYKGEINTPLDGKVFISWVKLREVKSATIKRYLTILKVLRRECFADIQIKVEERPQPKPLTKNEVDLILEELKGSFYYSHYYDFFVVLFNTGLRVSEAIGLQWKDVNLQTRELHIYEVLGRNKGNTSKRERRTTKTTKYRVVPINDKVFNLLGNKIRKGDLVFYSPEGHVLDDHNISQRCWKNTLEKLKVEHRPMRVTRSTFVSHGIASGVDPVDIAAITGHSLEVLYRHYLGSIKKPELPEL